MPSPATLPLVQATPKAQWPLFPPAAVHSSNLSLFRQWMKVQARYAAQRKSGACIVTAHGACAQARWAAFIDDLKSRPLAERVARANAYLNTIPYVTAMRNWGTPNYWETPFEFLAHGGQCQDYAISKYLALKASGVPDRDLRVAVVHDRQRNEDHAILIVTIHGRDFVLDNQAPGIEALRSVTRYRAYYAINDTGWWAYFDPKTHIAGAQVAAMQ